MKKHVYTKKNTWLEQAPVRLRQWVFLVGADERASEAAFVAYVPLPEEKEIEKRVLERKKADLLAKYTSAEERKTQEEAKRLVGA